MILFEISTIFCFHFLQKSQLLKDWNLLCSMDMKTRASVAEQDRALKHFPLEKGPGASKCALLRFDVQGEATSRCLSFQSLVIQTRG